MNTIKQKLTRYSTGALLLVALLSPMAASADAGVMVTSLNTQQQAIIQNISGIIGSITTQIGAMAAQRSQEQQLVAQYSVQLQTILQQLSSGAAIISPAQINAISTTVMNMSSSLQTILNRRTLENQAFMQLIPLLGQINVWLAANFH